MGAWIFARGREGETTLPGAAAAGVKTLALAGGAATFALGQKVLIGAANDGAAEWLGRVTQVSSSAVSFVRPLKSAWAAGAKFWRAKSVFELPAELAVTERRSLATGVKSQRSLAGQLHAIQLAEPHTDLRLELLDLPAAVEEGLLAWLAAQTRWGLDPFTLIEPAGRLIVVQVQAGPIELTREAGGRRRCTLPLAILQEGAYQ